MPESKHYKLLHIIDDDTLDYTRTRGSETWKGILSVKDYLLREQVLCSSDMGKHHMAFMLVNETTDERLCSCEVTFRDGFQVSNRGGDDVPRHATVPGAKKIKIASITAVFTYPEYRGHGYARIMFEQLIQQMTKLGVSVLMLHSEIGEYYAKHGFKSFHVPMLTKSIASTPKLLTQLQDRYQIGDDVIKLIGYKEFKPLIDVYNHHTNQAIINSHHDKIRVSIDVNEHIVDWFHLRAKYIHYQTFSSKPPIDFSNIDAIDQVFKTLNPQKFGMTLEIGGSMVGYVIWTYDWSNDGNYITVINLFTIPGFDHLKPKLLSYFEDYIKLLNSTNSNEEVFNTLKIWSSDISNRDFGGKEIENSSLGAIRMLDNDDQTKLQNGDVVWENNNKFPWY